MKIWIDLTNSPHVNFFSKMIRELQRDHQVLLTCRPLANTIELLQLEGLPHSVVGRHYGRSNIMKITGFFIRTYQLYLFLKNQRIDAAISHSSFYSPIVARMLGVRCIYLNDNEHAAGNRIAFLFADRIMVPEFIDHKKIVHQWARAYKIVRYPGVKEGVYLWDNYKPLETPERSLSGTRVKKNIYVRPEPWTAQYYKGGHNFMDALLLSLAPKYRVSLLPRGNDQIRYYKHERFYGVQVLEKSIPMADIMSQCDCFIGAGGTMTREAAVLGIPTISIYQDALLDVDRFLINSGAMIHTLRPTERLVTDFLASMEKLPPNKDLMHKGQLAYELIKSELLK